MTKQPSRRNWLTRMRDGLHKSSNTISTGITAIFKGKAIDRDALSQLEDLLIGADLGVTTAHGLVTDLGKHPPADTSADGIRAALAQRIADSLRPVAQSLSFEEGERPQVVLVVGVNGTGKTTTIAKLAARLSEQGKSVMLAAGDTFRAAAIEQLQVWGDRLGCPVIAKQAGSDPAAVAYEAYEHAKASDTDVLLIDTAGRLHNKADLMAQLQKTVKALKKIAPEAPHHCVLVLDATTGQNAHMQVQTFRDLVSVTGLVVTKLDGSARGGVVVALAERFGLPIHAVGVGEGADDLQPFDPDEFSRALVGIAS